MKQLKSSTTLLFLQYLDIVTINNYYLFYTLKKRNFHCFKFEGVYKH